jgi:hypothetical protein
VSPGPCRTCRWDTNARQHGCCGPLSASTPSTFWSAFSTSANRAPTGCARCHAGRRAHRRDDSRSDGGALGLRTAIPPRPARRYDGVRRLRQYRRGDAQGSPWPPCSNRQRPQRFRLRRIVARLRQRAATRHFARVCGVGFDRGAGPSDILTVLRRRGLLVRLLRRLQRWELRPRAGVLRRDHQRSSNVANAAEAGDGEVPPGPGTRPRQGAGPSAPPSSPPRGADVNTQLAQARELEAKLAEEYRAVRLLRASIAGEASARGERAR